MMNGLETPARVLVGLVLMLAVIFGLALGVGGFRHASVQPPAGVPGSGAPAVDPPPEPPKVAVDLSKLKGTWIPDSNVSVQFIAAPMEVVEVSFFDAGSVHVIVKFKLLDPAEEIVVEDAVKPGDEPGSFQFEKIEEKLTVVMEGDSISLGFGQNEAAPFRRAQSQRDTANMRRLNTTEAKNL